MFVHLSRSFSLRSDGKPGTLENLLKGLYSKGAFGSRTFGTERSTLFRISETLKRSQEKLIRGLWPVERK
jgi:hypothetical protein